MGAIRAVFFDLDGTLRFHEPGALETMYRLAQETGLPVEEELFPVAVRWSHAYWASSRDLAEDVEYFGELNEGFWQRFTARFLIELGCTPPQAENCAATIHRRFTDEWQPQDRVMPGAATTLAALKAQGLIVGVVTNRTQPVDDYLQTIGLGDWLDFSLAAGQVEAWKPHPDIFHHALAQFHLQPAQALYVGDNYFADILGAERAGLKAVLFDRLGVFPDAACQVIARLEEVLPLVGAGLSEQRPT